jgi:S-adenosylmethionine hydrolase
MTLWRSAPWLHDSVVLAVVDPGVGTSRRPVAIEVTDTRTVLVGPDNGLLLPAALALGPVTSAVRLGAPTPAYPRPPGAGGTFDGRDLFGPVAARIAAGDWAVEDAGDPLEPSTLIGGPIPSPVHAERDRISCEVLWVDRFGNAQLNATPSEISRLGKRVRITAHSRTHQARLVGAFQDLADGELGLVTDSYGLLALAFNASPAAEILRITEGDSIRIGVVPDG